MNSTWVSTAARFYIQARPRRNHACYPPPPPHAKLAFSLVELAIVLVILGLLVGGVLSGRALIQAAELRSQINQIQEFSIATKTFKDKYFYWPGDLPEPIATQAGFKARGVLGGQGDGNGIVAGFYSFAPTVAQYYIRGEPALFWTDLSAAGLVSGNFTTATATSSMPSSSSPTVIDQYMPTGKIANTSIFVAGGSLGNDDGFIKEGKSYFALQRVSSVASSTVNSTAGNRGVRVIHAYMIDSKFDDGNPIQGKVAGLRQNAWTIAGDSANVGIAVAASATTCYDNGNNAAGAATYSASFNNGEGLNCGLFFDVIN